MLSNRRSIMGLVAGATVSALLGGRASAGASASRVLILGGTGFIGPHFVDALLSHGHAVTLFNRGRNRRQGGTGVEQLVGDRNGQLDALLGRNWDVVVDDSGYTPRQVRLTGELLKDHVGHYIFISSISAYADFKSHDIDENYPLARLKDPTVETITGGTYGGLKALCERVVEQLYGRRCALLRPTYIVGPGDSTDRFTYWPVRVSRGGEMLAPGSPSDPIQFIDVRDLAEFVRLCAERRLPGTYNVCNVPRSVTMGMLLDVSKRITGADTRIVWANTRFLEAEKLIGADSSGMELPIWSAPTGEDAGVALVSCARAVAQGLRFRPLAETVRDTVAWQRQRPAAEQTLHAGLTADRETQLLRELHNFAQSRPAIL